MREPFACGPGLRSMRTLVPAAALLLVLLVAACGAGEPGAVGGSTGAAEDAPPPTVPAPDRRSSTRRTRPSWSSAKARATAPSSASAESPTVAPAAVRRRADRQLGLGRGRGQPVRRPGTTWGEFHVVGTYDGESSRSLTSDGRSPTGSAPVGPVRSFTTSCPEPAGGWPAAEIGVGSRGGRSPPARRSRSARPDHVALWVDYGGDLTPEEMDQAMVDGTPVARS